jgi:FixJ family two-component response regulator
MSHLPAMKQRLILHIVDRDSRSRAEQARIAFSFGHHAEVYSDLDELLGRPPYDGIILLRQQEVRVTFGELFERLGDHGIWLPVIVCAEEPQLDRAVEAIKSGVLDYLQLPLEAGRLACSLARVTREADDHLLARQRLAEARRRVVQLSKREREVLELLSLGSSNKIIARELGISPRTVEIHRANMMTKLHAGHAVEAVRLWLQSGLEATMSVPTGEIWPGDGRRLVLRHDFARRVEHGEPDEDEDRSIKEQRRTRSR